MAQPGRIEGGRLGFAQGFSNLIASRRHDADLRAAQRLQKETLGAMFEPVLVPRSKRLFAEEVGGRYEYNTFKGYSYTLGYRLKPGITLTPSLIDSHPEVFKTTSGGARAHIFATSATRADYYDVRLGSKITVTRSSGYPKDDEPIQAVDPKALAFTVGDWPHFAVERRGDVINRNEGSVLDRVIVTVPLELTPEQALQLHMQQGYEVDTIALDMEGVSDRQINNVTSPGMLNLVALRDSDAPASRRIR